MSSTGNHEIEAVAVPPARIRAGDVLPSTGSASELGARIAAGEALTLIRPGVEIDRRFELPAWSAGASSDVPAETRPE